MAFYQPGERKIRPGVYITITNRSPNNDGLAASSNGADIAGILKLSEEGILIYTGASPVLTDGVLVYTPTPILTDDGVLAIG